MKSVIYFIKTVCFSLKVIAASSLKKQFFKLINFTLIHSPEIKITG